jgi:heavy metal sensor kinase
MFLTDAPRRFNMRLSIRARLTLWYSAVLFAVFVGAAFAVLSLHVRLEIVRIDEELIADAHTVNGVLRNEFSERLTPLAAVHDMLDELDLPLVGVAIVDANRRVLGSRMPGQLEIDERVVVSASESPAFVGSDQEIRIRAVRTEIEGAVYQIVVWTALDEVDREEDTLRRALVLGIPLALLLAVVGGWAVGRRALRPLADMAQQANAIGPRASGQTLRAANPSDELGTLASAFNALLGRLSVSLQAQRAFMADASHQLRNPVSVVRTAAQVTLSRQGRSEEEYRESLEVIARQSERLTKMVDDMFTLALADANARPLQKAPLYLDEVVDTVARDATPLAAARRIAVKGDTPGDVPFVGDEHLLRQMVANLVENAIRYTREGGTIVVSLAQAATRVHIRVCDEGPGIAPADRPRIFERFVRLDTAGGESGGGLGLPIARWIAEAHGGSLDLESSSEKGSCFIITLPASGSEDVQREMRAPA